jgi:F-box and WD-40 domain protein CDC4
MPPLTRAHSELTAVLMGHTALVCQLHLCPRARTLVTGGSDGRVITYALADGLGPATPPPPPAAAPTPTPAATTTAVPAGPVHGGLGLGLRSAGSGSGAGAVAPYPALFKLPAHDSSVSALALASCARLVSAGAEGRVRVFDAQSGAPLRALGADSESVWKVAAVGNAAVVCCKRAGRTVVEIWGFAPREEAVRGVGRWFA